MCEPLGEQALMAILVREPTKTAEAITREAKVALEAYASLVWQVPESHIVYGYIDEGVLHAVVVAAFLSSAQLRRIFRMQGEVDAQFPQFEWAFHVFDQKDSPYAPPIPNDVATYRFDRPNLN